jgi:hypothetical protein
MARRLYVVRDTRSAAERRQWRQVRVWEWVADVHWIVYPLLVVAFFWWLAYGHR